MELPPVPGRFDRRRNSLVATRAREHEVAGAVWPILFARNYMMDLQRPRSDEAILAEAAVATNEVALRCVCGVRLTTEELNPSPDQVS